MERLGATLGVQPAELIADPPTVLTVYSRGNIDDGGLVDPIFDYEDAAIEDNAVPFDIEIGTVGSERTAWYFVSTENFYPFFRIGDLVRFTYRDNQSHEEYFGRLCLLHLDTNDKRVVIGVPNRGSDPGHFDIQIIGGAPLRNAPVKEIAVASMALFDPNVIRDEDGYPSP
ncbi:hypothetical protein MGN01_04190 [Methylobacterium gnaphalii]|uniref:Uncharacterized protein n=2 Tax=Methylobacterium gnaphalii TaxID=1010610 RepID=A0A512JF57_9HYPH|nr:hypothetical protein MGN01_04190 [Methylobacterium gnaphalii]GLS50791.1 hypothetical protein GCM10007885_36450 [Methylobacterium gnaphalii]